MTTREVTLEQLANISAIDACVGAKPSRRWSKASLVTRRWDGHSVASWFRTYPAATRVEMVRVSLLEGTAWAPLLRVRIPKASGAGMRAVDMPTIGDQARIFPLSDWLSLHAERVLSRIAVAFRRGFPLPSALLAAAQRANERPFASVIDISSFFDTIPWDLVDRTLRGLPADGRVRALLSSLTRVEVVERASGLGVTRSAGVPQGISPAPSLANLILHQFDITLAHRLSPQHVHVRRACDDLLLMGPSRIAVETGVHRASEALSKLGFSVKAGTGVVVDTRVEPVCWLGVAIGSGGLTVPDHVLARKIAALQAKVDAGVLSREGVEASLAALHNYYRRIVVPAHADAAIASVASRLGVPDRPHAREEVHRRLRELVEDRSGWRPNRTSADRWRRPAAESDSDGQAPAGADASPRSREAL